MDLPKTIGADLMLAWIGAAVNTQRNRQTGRMAALPDPFLFCGCVRQGPIREHRFHGVDCYCHRLASHTSSGKGQTGQVRHKEWT